MTDEELMLKEKSRQETISELEAYEREEIKKNNYDARFKNTDKTKKIVRCFSVDAKNDIQSVAYKLDETLVNLQRHDWEILNIFEEKYKYNDTPKSIDSVKFIIIAQAIRKE